MARAILDVRDEPCVRTCDIWSQLIEQSTHRAHDVDVGLLVPTANVVSLTETTAREHRADRAAMIGDVEPVTNLLTIAVDRQWLACKRVDDHQRNELFGKMIRPVVVRAIGRHDWQAVGVVPSAHEMIARRLTRGIRAVGLVRVGLSKRRIVWLQAAVDLVGAHVVETKSGLVAISQALPISTSRFEQNEGALDIGFDEGTGPVDAAIHMAFGGEMHNGARLMLRDQRANELGISNVTFDEVMPWLTLEAREILQISGVGQRIQINDSLAGHRCILEPLEDEVTSNEACAAGDEYRHCELSRLCRAATRASCARARRTIRRRSRSP